MPQLQLRRRRVRYLPSLRRVSDERRDYDRRKEAQCRIVEFVCNHPEGSTCFEAAAAAHMPDTGARRVLRRLASRHLVRCDERSRWKPMAVLMSPPSLCAFGEGGDDNDFNGVQRRVMNGAARRERN